MQVNARKCSNDDRVRNIAFFGKICYDTHITVNEVMSMGKVLIADASQQWREILARALSGEYQVRACPDGLRALELVEQFEPDVLVMDLMLAGTDGLSVLKAIADRRPRPRVIITGRYFSNYIMSALDRYQVEFVAVKPCSVSCITDQVAELMTRVNSEPVTVQDPFDYITALLVSLGARTSQQGFRFLRTGILLLMEDPSQQLTKSLYPAIGKEHNTTGTNVEKAIRTTIYTAWLHRREEVWRQYFPLAPNGQIPKPTSGQFLARMVDTVRSALRHRA